MNEERYAKIYQQIEWTVHTNLKNPCTDGIPDGWIWNSDYQVCMKNTLPLANVGRFLKDGDQLKFVAFEQEDESRSTPPTAYKGICDGDSGSGQWVTVKDDDSSASSSQGEDTIRRVLVALSVTGFAGYYKLNGQFEEGVCGGNLALDNGERLIEGTVAVKTTNGKLLGFIKKRARICKNKRKGSCVIS